MRPRPLAAGFQFCRPGSVSCASKSVSVADARRDRLSEMPLAVTHFTNSRREGRMFPPLVKPPGSTDENQLQASTTLDPQRLGLICYAH